ncbi:hypothetical protein DASC09_055410 [Saccharomycopsis crataegensis]|uniref:Uncharacterized protein n=1 Tax=Saccharomycopsis crataegensis TaxID=43959 RepID=A0AAV5QTI9_9ASCO|nr:hypothetical protein DASC09_055410 [Saccharomycopsis crataegensis]
MASEGLERCIPDDMFTFIGSSGAQKRSLIEFKRYNLSITMDSMINGSGDEGVLNAEWELLTNKVAHEIKYCEIRITDTIFTVRAVLAAYLFYIFRSDNQVAKRIVTEAFELVRKSPEEIDSIRCTGGLQSSTELIYLCHQIKLLEAGKSDPIIAQKFLEYGNIDWCKNGDDFHGA